MTKINRIEIKTPFALDRVNCYYIKDSIPTLIDAGLNTQESFEVVESAIRESGGKVEKLRRIILTHAHSDHIGLVPKLVQLSGAEVYIHKRDVARIAHQGEEDFSKWGEKFRGFFLEAGVPIDIAEQTLKFMSERFSQFYSAFTDVKPLQGGEIFSFDDFSLEVMHTPGHTPGSICMFDREGGTFLSGDTLLEKITSNPMVELDTSVVNDNYRAVEQYMTSLSLVDGLPVSKVLPGHGRPFTNHRQRVEELYTHHRDRMEKVLQILKSDKTKSNAASGMTPFMVAESLFRSLEGIDLFLGLSEAQGHLEVLEQNGLAFSRNQGGHRLYYLENNNRKSVPDLV